MNIKLSNLIRRLRVSDILILGALKSTIIIYDEYFEIIIISILNKRKYSSIVKLVGI